MVDLSYHALSDTFDPEEFVLRGVHNTLDASKMLEKPRRYPWSYKGKALKDEKLTGSQFLGAIPLTKGERTCVFSFLLAEYDQHFRCLVDRIGEEGWNSPNRTNRNETTLNRSRIKVKIGFK